MNLNQLATGVLSGYIFKAAQVAISLVIVPFLLAPDVLGVDDYGRTFAILGATGLFSIATIGLHNAADRAITRAVASARPGSTDVSELLGSAIKVHALVSLAWVVPFVVFDEWVLRSLGIPVEAGYSEAVWAAGAISLLECALYPVRSPLIARGDIAYANLITMLELLFRTASVFLVFSWVGGSVSSFLAIQAFFTLARQIAYYYRLAKSDRVHLVRAPIARAFETIRYAGPVSLAEGSTLLVRNLPVILASRFLGPTDAGYVAVVANTLQGYVLQIFLAVFQPIAVPIASRLRLAQASSSKRARFRQLEAGYAFVIACVFGQAIIWTPVLLPVWLGSEFVPIVLATQIMIAGCGIQTSNLIRRSILIGHGLLPDAVPAIVASALVSSISMAIAFALFHTWFAAIVIGTMHMIVSSAFGIDRVFSRNFHDEGSMTSFPHVVSVTSILVVAWVIGRLTAHTPLVGDIGLAVLGGGVSAAMGFATLIPLRSAQDLVGLLYRVRGVDLFD